MPDISLQQVGYGAGTRDIKGEPNVIRLMLGNTAGDGILSGAKSEKLVVLESNIDDASPQTLGFAMERAFEANALDCWFTPIQMKKDRPATLLSVLCEPSDVERIQQLLFRETTTIGIRKSEVERVSLERTSETLVTEFGEVQVKVSRLDGKVLTRKAEFDDVKRIASETGEPLRSIAAKIERILDQQDEALTKAAAKG